MKLHAIIAIGDVCLASEESIMSNLGMIIDSLISAASMSLNKGQDEDEQRNYSELRSHIVAAYQSVLHSFAEIPDGLQHNDINSAVTNMTKYM